MIRKYLKQMIVTSVVTLLPMLLGLVMWDTLPDTMVTHWGVSGEADGFSSKAFSVFGLPLIMLVTQWICILVTLSDPRNKEQSGKIFTMVMWIIPVVSLITNGLVYAASLGNTVGIEIGMKVLMGLMFIVLGNYLPKCKQNHTIGIRVKWTLENEENWNKTHRFTGRLWVAGGVVFLATMFIPGESMMWLFLVVVFGLSFIPVLYSYLYHRKLVKEGRVLVGRTENAPKEKSWEKKITIISIIISIPILVLVVALLFTGSIDIEFGDSAFTIESACWDDLTVEYDRIGSVEFRNQDESGSRTFGYGSLKLEMGKFKNKEFGAYTRYSYIECDSCIVIYSKDGQVLVINGEDEAATKAIYEELSRRVADMASTLE